MFWNDARSARIHGKLNTLILLLSGCSVTWSHHAILHGFRKEAILSLIITTGLAFIFTSLQGLEYISANFNISDGIYGATFYLATGFHGLHGARKLVIYFNHQ